jgi:hypothetical protein
MFETLKSVFNTCHFIKMFKTQHVSASIGHHQVLKKSHKHARKQQGIRHTEDRDEGA